LTAFDYHPIRVCSIVSMILACRSKVFDHIFRQDALSVEYLSRLNSVRPEHCKFEIEKRLNRVDHRAQEYHSHVIRQRQVIGYLPAQFPRAEEATTGRAIESC
jgi:hypothetical protein